MVRGCSLASNISGIIIPIRGTTGPTWAYEFNISFSAIDAHNHAPNSGVTLSFDVVNFIDDFNCEVITDAELYNFSNNAFEKERCSLFSDGNDLFATDGFGRQIKITSQGKLNLTYVSGGGFSGDYVSSAAQVVYATVPNTYTFLGAGGIGASTIICSTIGNIKEFTFSLDNTIQNLTITCPTPTLTWASIGVIADHTVITGFANTGQAVGLAPYVPVGNGGGTTVISNTSLFYSSGGPAPAFQYYSVFFRGPTTVPTGVVDTLELTSRNSVNVPIVHPPVGYFEPLCLGGISQSAPLAQVAIGVRDILLKYSDNLTLYSSPSNPNFWTNNMVFSMKYVMPT